MIIAIMSDTHDHIWNVRKALEILRSQRADSMIQCGDLVAPCTLRELAAFDGPGSFCLFDTISREIELVKLA